MEIRHWHEVPEATLDEAPGVTIRWVIDETVGAPRFAMRVFEVAPEAATPWHAHWYEQEMFILEGEGVVRTEEGEAALRPGTVVFVRPYERHEFRNTGAGVLRFICCIPLTEPRPAPSPDGA